MTPAPAKVLLVDDDALLLPIHAAILRRFSYQVRTADSVDSAMALLESEGFESFAAIVTDYRMPKKDGAELLRLALERDRTLGVLIVTAQGDKEAVATFLRDGAQGFLDKPVEPLSMREAVEKAVAYTTQQRALRQAASELREVGLAQRALLGRNIVGLNNRSRVFFHPHGEAGGDFVTAFPLDANRFLVLVSDISGHDLQAAYRSAYLQGFARALLGNGFDIETSFRKINDLLLREWNNASQEILSLASCAVCVDPGKETLGLLNCGLPAPWLCDARGFAQALSANVSCPLGWFDDLPRISTHPIAGGRLMVYSDGLEDLALKLDLSPLALASLFLSGHESHVALLGLATDDIIVVDLDLSPVAAPPSIDYAPVLSELYAGSEMKSIDGIQDYCERSLKLAIPGMDDAKLHDALICLREALINGMLHGCGQSPSLSVHLQVSMDASRGELLIRVTDNGPGYVVDPTKLKVQETDLSIYCPHGLAMISNLTRTMDISATGNSLTMHLSLSPEQDAP